MSSESKTVSIIITVKNNGVDLYTTMESLKVSRTSLPYEVIIVDEGSVDGCCDFLLGYRFEKPFKRLKGMAGVSARNLGAAHAAGDYLIFCGAHLYYDDGWMEALLDPLFKGEADCCSPSFVMHERSVSPKTEIVSGWLKSIRSYPAVAEDKMDLPWLSWECFAIRKDRFQEIGGMEDGFAGKELETAEFSFRMWLLGGTCRYVPEVSLVQVFRQNFPYDHSGERWGRDLMMLACLHFSEPQISFCRQLVEEVFGREGGDERELRELRELTEERRRKYALRRQHDETWFLKRFGIVF
ncbi:MAG: glycosyltransferase [Paenibacillus macerans]|nr:glycosyltransferase [Paenibacillus macerans]MBS5914118.1 glycosyltransferase [Paenibacillus macerans]MCY7562247.1 glycosyltransferase [Paenibacillus macerans]MDU7476930.1 glycosyltransferase [Paenibacillus macerans]MEC0155054.1 glycosyltransferase [Paenibacillus macerans]GBK60420.1 glycosyl transferase [Paenibacillus macerans]